MKRAIYIVLLLVFCIATGSAWADDQQPSATDDQIHGIQRFGRGVVNTFSSPLELLAQPYARASYYDEKSNNQFAVIGGFFEGIPMGFVYDIFLPINICPHSYALRGCPPTVESVVYRRTGLSLVRTPCPQL